ncbi:MAG: choice-of-anchor M domain-containing protein, partial [Bowdeniella nasicola]|nr:choice-of-anchor M domain-containing protein [Bowdeniella nasicola]
MLGAGAVSASLLAPTPALSGPDDGRPVVTRGHVDSPHIVWENGGPVLDTHASNVPGRPGDLHPMDAVVHWSGTGYDSLRDGHQQYMFTPPDKPEFAFLKSDGGTWYMAPAVPGGNHDPIWLGFGTDANVPTEELRDGLVSLDLISVNGPGRVEQVNWFDEGDGYLVSRFFSSSDMGYRTQAAPAGTHTHNATLFSVPGRYELTYQATARLKDGTLIHSKPTVQTWHVGGTRPADKKSEPLEKAYAAAKAGTPKTAYEFSAKATAGELTGREEGRLTTFSFDAHDSSVNGMLSLSLQGFHFADLPVKNGVAEASLYAGADNTTLQATFVPAAGSQAVRWRSEPLAFSAKDRTLSTTSKNATDTPVAQKPAPSPTADVSEHHLTDRSYTATITPIDDTHYKVDIDFADKNVMAFIEGGFYQKDEGADALPNDNAGGVLTRGHYSTIVEDNWSRTYQSYAKLIVKPHPSMAFGRLEIPFEGVLPFKKAQTVKGTVPEGGAPAPEPTPSPTTPAP